MSIILEGSGSIPISETLAGDDYLLADVGGVVRRVNATAASGSINEQIDDWGAEFDARVSVLEESAVGGKLIKATWTDLLAITPPSDGYGGEVLESDTGTHSQGTATGYDGATVANSGVYTWNAGWSRWVRIADVGLAGKADLADFLVVEARTANVVGGYDQGITLADKDGFATATLSPDGLWCSTFEISAYEDGTGDLLIVDQYGLGDAAGAGIAAAVSNFVVTTPLMPDALYGVSGVEYSLHTGGLTQDRAVECSLLVNGSEGFARHGQYEVAFDPAQLSGSATVSLHTSKTGATYGEQVATVYVAPQPPVNTAPSILALGDSILTRGGASIIGAYLEDWGYTPTFVGTLADHGEGVHGPVNAECKPGHLMADQTYAITTRVSPLAPGDEAAYAAMTTVDKRLKNTIIRAASGEAAGDIRNGYVLDFANYFSRHSLTPTDLLVVTYGTNDIRDIAAASIYDHIYDEASLIIRRWFASYPNKHVVLGLPGTAWRADRNLIWAASYSEVIRALIKAAADETTANGGTGKAIVAASWAGATPYAGYDLLDATADETDAATGAEVRDIEDEIHPTGGTRWATHKTIAAAIACAAEGTI